MLEEGPANSTRQPGKPESPPVQAGVSPLKAVLSAALSNPFAAVADIFSALMPPHPFPAQEVLPPDIRYSLRHGARSLSLQQVENLAHSRSFADAALYLSLKMMHGFPAHQVELLQAVAQHVSEFGPEHCGPQFTKIIATHLGAFSSSTGLAEVGGYSKLAAINRMGPAEWGRRFSTYFNEFYRSSHTDRSLLLVAYATGLGFRHLCHALPFNQCAYMVVHKPLDPPSAILGIHKDPTGHLRVELQSIETLTSALRHRTVHLVDDMIKLGRTLEESRSFLIERGLTSPDRCQGESVWGQTFD